VDDRPAPDVDDKFFELCKTLVSARQARGVAKSGAFAFGAGDAGVGDKP
jgi:hypothetical protein